MSQFTLAVGSEEKTVNVRRTSDQLTIELDGQTAVIHILSVERHQIMAEQLLENGQRRRMIIAGVAKGDERQLWVNGRYLNVRRVRKTAVSGPAADQGSLAATIPAVVTELLVQVGDTVTAGQKLILLESMKMVIPIQAPYDGTIKAIHCQAGDSVQAGIPLIELSAAD